MLSWELLPFEVFCWCLCDVLLGVTCAAILVTTQWPLKRAPHLTSLTWGCVVWRSDSSLGLSALRIWRYSVAYTTGLKYGKRWGIYFWHEFKMAKFGDFAGIAEKLTRISNCMMIYTYCNIYEVYQDISQFNTLQSQIPYCGMTAWILNCYKEWSTVNRG